jgi:hypothetical protein
MNRNRHALMLISAVALVAAALACNAPSDPTPPGAEGPPPTVTPYVAPDETDETEEPEEPAPEAQPSVTHTPEVSPTPTITPTATATITPTRALATATPTQAPSSGPLDFTKPTSLTNWEPIEGGGNRVTIAIQITGGAPPYVVHHDLESFTTSETNPTITYTAHGCGALVHTIKVESADGQEVSHGYYIGAPWCAEEE